MDGSKEGEKLLFAWDTPQEQVVAFYMGWQLQVFYEIVIPVKTRDSNQLSAFQESCSTASLCYETSNQHTNTLCLLQ